MNITLATSHFVTLKDEDEIAIHTRMAASAAG